MIEVTFYNVTISLKAADAKAAYERLCELLDPITREGGEYTTDDYGIEGTEGRDILRSTVELFPEISGR